MEYDCDAVLVCDEAAVYSELQAGARLAHFYPDFKNKVKMLNPEDF